MTQDKKERLVISATVVAVITLFLLVIILTYQFISVAVKRNRCKELTEEIARLEQEIENAEENVELWQQDWKIEERARQLDYVYKKDKDKSDK